MSLLGLEVLAYGEESDLLRACADCGQVTGRFCEALSGDGDCMAVTWIPAESWLQGQRAPLCSSCDWRLGACHFCRRRVARDGWHTPSDLSADTLGHLERESWKAAGSWDSECETYFVHELARSALLRVYARIFGFAVLLAFPPRRPVI